MDIEEIKEREDRTFFQTKGSANRFQEPPFKKIMIISIRRRIDNMDEVIQQCRTLRTLLDLIDYVDSSSDEDVDLSPELQAVVDETEVDAEL